MSPIRRAIVQFKNRFKVHFRKGLRASLGFEARATSSVESRVMNIKILKIHGGALSMKRKIYFNFLIIKQKKDNTSFESMLEINVE